MPKCIVDYCRNYAGMKNNYTNVILHAFPTTLDRIKLWLQAIEQSGQIFGNLDEMAKKIYEGKKFDSYRVCSEHFTIQCYCVNADKRVLKKESVPTVFVNRHAMHVSKQIKKRKRQEMLNTLDSRHLKKKGTESTSTKIGQELAQKLLNLTLDIIALLTGEDYVVVKKSCPRVKLDRRTQCSEVLPESQVLDWVNEHMILDLTSKMFDLLTGEEEDGTDGHEEASTEVMMKNPQSFPLPGVFQETNTATPCLSSSGSMDVEEVVVQDVQEAKHFKISTWTAISEANGTKKLVLCEGDAVQDSGSNEIQTSSARVVEEPLLSGGGNLKVYTQHVSTQEEPVPQSRGNQPHTDLSTQCSSPVITERSPCDGVIPPPDHAEQSADNMDQEPRTSKRQNLTERDITEPSDHQQQDSSTHIKGETQSLPSLDQLQYTSVIINEEHLSPSAENSHLPDTDTPAVHPQHTALVIKEGPGNCADGRFTHTDASAGDQTWITSKCLKEEPGSCEEKTFTQPTIHTATSDTHCIFFTIK